MQRPLPEGVDPTRIEQYLNDDEFTVRCDCAGEAMPSFNSFVYCFYHQCCAISFSLVHADSYAVSIA